MSKSEEIEIDIEILAETDKAIMLENLQDEKVWLPKSQIDISASEDSMLIPEWLAIDKELI